MVGSALLTALACAPEPSAPPEDTTMAPSLRVKKLGCRPGDEMIVWTAGLDPDRNGNGLVCLNKDARTKKNTYYDDR